jgi:hypothetical protein
MRLPREKEDTMATLTQSELLAGLKAQGAALGLRVRDDGAGLSGDMEAIRAKWFLGSRKVAYRMLCRLADAEHTVHFREAVIEKSWGMPPPTFTMEITRVSGWKRSGARIDRSVGGGGTLDSGRVREALEQTVTGAGWRFHLGGGRMP